MTMLKRGSTLITNTMLVQSARLFLESGQLYDVAETIFDFCTLVEAVILRNRLLTLDGDLLGRDGEFNDSVLPKALREHGILCQNAVPIDVSDVQRSLCLIVGTDRVFNRIDVRGFRLSVPDMLPEVFPDEARRSSCCDLGVFERHNFMMLARHNSAKTALTDAESLFRFFRGNDFVDYLRGTGDEHRGGYALRTYLYNRAASRSNIAFMPDYPRVPFLEALIDEIYTSVVTEGHQLLAERLGVEAREFLRDARPLGLPLPPFTSILLSRCESASEVVPRLMEMRDEFQPLRDNLTELETRLASSATIEERNKARARVEGIFAATAKRFDVSGYTVFKSMLDYTGDATGPMFDWSNPGSYKTSLVTKPLEWLRDWWRRRPVAQLFQVAREFRRMSEYSALFQKVFGVEVNPREVESFERAVRTIHQTFRKVRDNAQEL